MRKETKMLCSTILILTGLVITGGSTMTKSMAPTMAELTRIKDVATTASPSSKHLNTLKVGQTSESVTMMGFTNQTTTFVETSAESNITSSTTSSVHSTSTAIRITSKPNMADSLTTTPSSIVTETQTLKTEITKAMTTIGKITTPSAHTTKRIPSTSKVFLSSSEQSSTTRKTFTIRQHKITVGQHKKEPDALSSGSVAAIVIGFIAIVIIVLGGAYYFKMRRSSYGRLLDDTNHSSQGNFFNPMFDG